MGQRKSKPSNKYDITQVADSEFTYKKPREPRPMPVVLNVPATVPENEEVAQVETPVQSSATPAEHKQPEVNVVPAWVTEEYFVDVVKKDVAGFKKISNFKAFPALKPGENYATLMLRVTMDVETEGGDTKSLSYMLKVAHDTEQGKQMEGTLNVFDTELIMYRDVLPELEDMYKRAGKEVCLGPRHYEFVKKPNCNTVLLEDLKPKGFKNANRLEGLDMEHTKLVLTKLAELHAGSATRIANKGRYVQLDRDYEKAGAYLTATLNTFKTSLLANIKNYKDCERFAPHLTRAVDNLQQTMKYIMSLESEEFWVLNHGDSWSNNIMFTYTDDGKLKDAMFVDFQASHYMSPSKDLNYFILSSTSFDVKIAEFDYLISFYHERLIENLILLKYPKALPRLRDIHTQILNDNFIPIMVIMMLLPVVLLDSSDAANLDNLMAGSGGFHNLLFTNPRYVRQIEEILPWLYNRGCFEISEVRQAKSADMKSITPGETTATVKPEDTSSSRDWLNADTFADIIKESAGAYKSVKNFNVGKATAAGDNYSSEMLKIDVEVEMEDGSTKNAAYMLKLPLSSEKGKAMMAMLNTFKKEILIYNEYLLKFEQLARDNDLEIQLGPKSFKLSKDIGCESIIMENLAVKGFKNCDRLEGLDDEHTEAVLKKLAELHSISAAYYATHGNYPTVLETGIYTKENQKFFEETGKTYYNALSEDIKTYDGHAEYSSKVDTFFKNMPTIMSQVGEIDYSKFNVLNHGDCWTNNIMFQYDAIGKIANTYFVDFQMSKYGSPAQDLYYFILSSAKPENKLEKFDYYIRIYHEHLVKDLEALKYPKEIPTLQELHIDLLNNGAYAFNTCCTVLPVVLLKPTDNANVDSIMDDNSFQTQLFTNPPYRSIMQSILPWINRKGLLDVVEQFKTDSNVAQSPVTSDAVAVKPSSYEWLNVETFADVIKESVGPYKSIKNFNVRGATAGGDNYSSELLKIDVEAEMEDGSSKIASYMLKLPLSGQQSQAIMELMNTFNKELLMYDSYLAKFEKLARDNGLEIQLGPRSFKLAKDIGCKYVIMDNLQVKGFKNCDRQVGLDDEHAKAALKKLAQFHALSAAYYANNGKYPTVLENSQHTEQNRSFFEKFSSSYYAILQECIETYEGHEEYSDKTAKFITNLFSIMLEASKIDDSKFNVLNHGDCWTNNIMFQYDASGQIANTYFVDFQMPKYGSPAQDLHYFILSSVKFENKLEKFDAYIRFYHDHLVETLETLKYPKQIPTLKDIHIALLERAPYAMYTACGVMPITLLDASDDANVENMMKSDQFRKQLFTNPRYRQQLENILPWLNRKGFLDFDDLLTTENKVAEIAAPSVVPKWVDADHFTDVVAADIEGFSKILNISVDKATKGGDNFASILFKVDIDVELKDGSQKTVNYMLKIPPLSEMVGNMLAMWNMFPKEKIMYSEILPAFEKMYKDAGLDVKLGPKYYAINKPDVGETILMENLRPSGFANGDRLIGLDMEHVKGTLRKIAQIHAASRKYIEVNGPLPEIFNDGLYTEKSRKIFEYNDTKRRAYLEFAKEFEGCQDFYDKIVHMSEIQLDKCIELNNVNPDDFNVLNHGDSWLNNVMFQHDDSGNIQSTIYVDFQVCNYGSPAQDLYYFLITSAQLDIKLKEFDNFVKYYHGYLVEYLQILKYNGKVITLEELQQEMKKYGFYAYNTMASTLSICLLEPSEDATIDNLSADDDKGKNMLKQLFCSQRYKAQASAILQWLNSRGLMDF